MKSIPPRVDDIQCTRGGPIANSGYGRDSFDPTKYCDAIETMGRGKNRA